MTDQPGDLIWRKASQSSAQGSDCVEVAELDDGGRVVRHSQDPDGPRLRFTASEWKAFIAGVNVGEFD